MHDGATIPDSSLAPYEVPRPALRPASQSAPGAAATVLPAARVVGPGRLERGYLRRLEHLATEVDAVRERERELRRSLVERASELEASRRVERGCQRRLDRLEERLEERTQALLAAERAHKRLALVLGALQGENQRLRGELQLALAPPPPARGGSWLRRWRAWRARGRA